MCTFIGYPGAAEQNPESRDEKGADPLSRAGEVYPRLILLAIPDRLRRPG
ncbi:hypothetical protein MHY87_03620 [Microvirga sp. ACRRW]|nr:hypothetical protein [Microvirga sp. ACRRW]MCG7391988.1 hypothetical protein [Microvirga sp. ACRRW]